MLHAVFEVLFLDPMDRTQTSVGRFLRCVLIFSLLNVVGFEQLVLKYSMFYIWLVRLYSFLLFGHVWLGFVQHLRFA